jgi:hypothetical protein
MNKVTATIIYNEADDYAECVIDGACPWRFPSVIGAACHAGVRGATEIEFHELTDGDMLATALFWFRKGQERRAKQEAEAVKWSREAFYGERAQRDKAMSRNRFGEFRGLAESY